MQSGRWLCRPAFRSRASEALVIGLGVLFLVGVIAALAVELVAGRAPVMTPPQGGHRPFFKKPHDTSAHTVHRRGDIEDLDRS